MNREKENFKKS